MTINDLNSIRILSMLILAGMAGQYIAVAALAGLRIRQGHNGATLAILINGLALATLSVAILFYILLPLPEGTVMLAMLGVLLTNFYLIFSLRLEAHRPFKRHSPLMEKARRKLE